MSRLSKTAQDQDAIHAALQENAKPRKDERVEGALLVGWVVVAAWVAPDGESWTTRIASPDLPAFQRSGLLHQALFDADWEEAPDE